MDHGLQKDVKQKNKNLTPSLAFSNDFTHVQIIIQKKENTFHKNITAYVFNQYGFWTVQLESNNECHYGLVLFCAS